MSLCINDCETLYVIFNFSNFVLNPTTEQIALASEMLRKKGVFFNVNTKLIKVLLADVLT